MQGEKLYTTAAKVQAYVLDYYRQTHRALGFPEALLALRQAGLLSETRELLPPFPELDSAEALDRFILSFPLEAGSIIRDNAVDGRDALIKEVTLFPFEKDVFCFKHFPHIIEQLHAHDYFEITYLYAGSCRLLFDGETVLLEEGDLCIVPPMSPHNQPIDENGLAICIAVRSSTFDSIFGGLMTQKDLVSTFFRHSLYGDKQSNFLRLKTQLQPSVKTLLHQLIYECNQADPYANAICISLLNLFLAQVLRLYSDTAKVYRMDQLKAPRADFPLILQYIQQNFRTVSLTSLSKVFHYSQTYLCRMIQRNLNQSFSAIVRSLKLGRAREYLLNESLRVVDIAHLVGYGSVDHFSRAFKKAYGISPLRWRSTRAKA